ncbi:hypothetical protein GCM10010531_42610 [Blastococcus jejuensis]|uniref:HYR domain-containing protein n=1 Tax=Blastococcus jejuensis TaxID=351224 RepID=A0ABP6PQ86_9ACTN
MKRWALVTAAGLTLAAVAPAFPAAAATPTTVELVSGGAPVASSDPHTHMSLDSGETWQPAVVVPPHVLYDVFPGSGWISDASAGLDRQAATTLFRRSFTLPTGATATDMTVCVHADNAAYVFLNGTLIGAQIEQPIQANFQDPAECFSGIPQEGDNLLEFSVRNMGAWGGLDYRATVTYLERVNTPPVLELPADLTVEATGPGGTAVDFTPTATDDTGAQVSCEPPPGSTFPIGVTTVQCTATDDDDATTSGSFRVTVVDTTAPVLAQLPDLQAPAGPGGTATVTWSATATDSADPTPAVSCNPASGAVFPIGPTTVTCTATDAFGNTSSAPFVVTVVETRDVMDRLRDAIRATNVNPVTRAALLLGHRAADVQLDAGRTRTGCGLLQVLDVAIRASSRVIPAADAATMRALIAEARSTYGC